MSDYLDDLAKKITAKAAELGGVTRGFTQPVLTIQYFPELGEWQVWVPVKPLSEPGAVVVSSKDTIQKALQDVARETGAL